MSVAHDLLAAALRYAAEGLEVFPIWYAVDGRCACGRRICKSPAKHPITQRGFKDPTSDPEQIRRWWSQRPQANIGIRTGWYDGRGCLVGADLDCRADGTNGVDKYVALVQGELPQTRMTQTPSGGWHHIWSSGVEIGCGKLCDGIDIKGVGGYLIAPPSLSVSGGSYTNAGADAIAQIPDWLLTAILSDTQPSSSNGNDVPMTRRVSRSGKLTRSQRDWGGDVGRLADWDKRPEVKAALQTRLGISDKFVPCWRPSDSDEPSGELWFDGEIWVARDWGADKHGTPSTLTLTELYAASKLSKILRSPTYLELGNEQAPWKLRMLIELGFIEPYPLKLRLPQTLTPLQQTIYDDLVELTRCRWTAKPGAPVMFTIGFAKQWSLDPCVRRAPVGTVGAAINAIVAHGLYDVVGLAKLPTGGKPTKLLLPGLKQACSEVAWVPAACGGH